MSILKYIICLVTIAILNPALRYKHIFINKNWKVFLVTKNEECLVEIH